MLDPKPCYRQGGCGPYENYSCSECPASKPEYAERYKPTDIIRSVGTSFAVEGNQNPWTLHITNCKEVKFTVNGITVAADFENIDLNKIESIDINGHKFERAVVDTLTPMEKLQEALKEVEKALAPKAPDYLETGTTNYKTPSDTSFVCQNCPNYPANGGTGICHCILGSSPIIC